MLASGQQHMHAGDGQAHETGDGNTTRLESLAGLGCTDSPEGCKVCVCSVAVLPSFIKLGHLDDMQWLGSDCEGITETRPLIYRDSLRQG